MAFNIGVFGSLGDPYVIGDYRELVFKGKVTATFDPPTGDGGALTIIVDTGISRSIPITAAFTYSPLANGTVTPLIINDYFNLVDPPPNWWVSGHGYISATTTYEIYLFGPNTSGDTGYGVNVYDASGSVSASSAEPNLKVKSIHTVELPASTSFINVNVSATIPSMSKPALVSAPPFYSEIYGIFAASMETAFRRSGATSIVVNTHFRGNTGGYDWHKNINARDDAAILKQSTLIIDGADYD